MVQKLRRGILALLLLIMCVPQTPAARAQDHTEGDTVNYVLLIDASRKNETGETYLAACEYLLDILPSDGVKVSVIAYGYDGDSGDLYPYTVRKQPRRDSKYVHLISGLEPPADTDPALILDKLNSAFEAKEQKSPHGQALLAAADLLEQADTSEGMGRVILISDGIRASSDWKIEADSRAEAIETARENRWPIYTLRMDYGSGNADENGEAASGKAETLPMANIAQTTGAAAVAPDGTRMTGTWQIAADSAEQAMADIHDALARIVTGEAWTAETENGAVEIPCPIGNLVTEAVVAFSGADIQRVTVRSSENDILTFTDTGAEGCVSARRGEQHFVVRLDSPEPADWVITAHTAGDRELTVFRNTRTVVDIRLTGRNDMEEPLTQPQARNREICFSTEYYHLEQLLELDRLDQSLSAVLQIQSRRVSGNDSYKFLQELEMSVKDLGHATEYFVLDDLVSLEEELNGRKTCAYRARALLRREGESVPLSTSSWIYFTAEDILCEPLVTEIPELHYEANSKFEIDLGTLIYNEDEDSLEFTLLGRDGGKTAFSFIDQDGNETDTITGNPQKLTVKTNSHTGEYELTLHVKDGTELYPIRIPLTVEPHKPLETLETIHCTLMEGDTGGIVSWAAGLMASGLAAEQEIPMDDSVKDVTPAEGFDNEIADFSYDDKENIVTLRARSPGETCLQLLVEYDSYVKNEHGEYEPETHILPVVVTVKTANPYRVGLLTAAAIALFIAAVLLWIFLTSFSVNPRDCTISQISGNSTGIVEEPKTIPFSAMPIKNRFLWSRTTIAELIHNCISSTVSEQPGEEALDVNYEVFILMKDSIDACITDGTLKKIRIRGVPGDGYAMCITGIPQADLGCSIKVYPEQEQAPDAPLRKRRVLVKDREVVQIDIERLNIRFLIRPASVQTQT